MTSARDRLPIDHSGPVGRPFLPFPASALDQSIIDRFRAVARDFSAHVALGDRVRTISYGELAHMVDRIAGATAAAAAGRAGPVAILLPSDVTYPAAMLGILAGGRGFVPLDPANPDERNRLIATCSGAATVVTAGALGDRARGLFAHDLPIVDIETIGEAHGSGPPVRISSDDLAFIVYTSGSTGTPKGAWHTHRNLLHDVMQQTNTLHLDHTDRAALVYSPTVVGAAREIMMCLLNGASLHILPPRELQPDGLVHEIAARRITIFRTVPTLLRRIAEILRPDQRLDSVRVLGLGSQRVDWSDYDLFRRCCTPEAFLIVGIGSTECGGNYCHWFVDERMRKPGGRLPLGRVLPDAQVTIAGHDGRPVAIGEVGEFVLASRYIALGYWRDPERTAEAFEVDPRDPAVRVFRTGDTGRMRADGLLEFAGREDQQIKLRGHRIELGEIEFALAACAGVEDAAVAVRRDDGGLARAVAAYVELRAGVDGVRPRDLRLLLRQYLPQYMIPATIRIVDRLPRMPNLKIDRVHLARIDAENVAQIAVATDDPLVATIIEIFQSVLGDVHATVDDNVFTLGGDSLQAVRVALALEERLQVVIPISVFEEAHTIRELASWIKAQRAASDHAAAN